MSGQFVAMSDAEHELGRTSSRDFGRYLCAELATDFIDAHERGIGIEIIASRQQRHEHASVRCRNLFRERATPAACRILLGAPRAP